MTKVLIVAVVAAAGLAAVFLFTGLYVTVNTGKTTFYLVNRITGDVSFYTPAGCRPVGGVGRRPARTAERGAPPPPPGFVLEQP